MLEILRWGVTPESEIFSRSQAVSDVSGAVSEIIENVKNRGDEALYEYAEKFDGAKLTALEVTPDELDAAMSAVEPEFIEILKKAAENIRAFHSRQVREGFKMETSAGAVMGQKITPLQRAGLYVPGGTAAYPSTVLMNCIPAKLAGVEEVVLVSPPTGGDINPVILAAAKIAGADRVFRMGGAQAVAALAYGTESVPAVDKIVGPGNAFVAEAKRQVFGKVAIDMIAGPSEILIIADASADADAVAADMLSQAEHDKNATAVLITDSDALAGEVSTALERRTALLHRREIAEESIRRNGKIILTENIEDAVELSNRLAPEHLELVLDEPFKYLDLVKNAGSVFLGKYCPEALGDYMAGPNHTLPTGGTARFSSPLGVDDFIKKVQFSYFTPAALEAIGEDVVYFARKEGLDAHGESVSVRLAKK
ncbi:MAG: histidinol dehydrogenase [Oscillospiraceae bacterium]|nr:histidinol dehydrogenase [Oscillospiraceae bacterium]